jgi:hypothetical protein
MRAPELSVTQIVAWAVDFQERSGKWPTSNSGRIPGSLGETWQKIELALRRGGGGLPFKSSLAMLLSERCGVRNRGRLPPLTNELILKWADDHRTRTGSLPNINSGEVLAAPGETWYGINKAVHQGQRRLRGGTSLASLLRKKRGYRYYQDASPLSTKRILSWADAHHARFGSWPTRNSGAVAGAPNETWARIANALVMGIRGLPGGSSLAQFLALHRNVRNRKALPKLRISEIVQWADEHFEQTGRWPTYLSGPVLTALAETWSAVHSALRLGLRGLHGGSSLYQVLRQYREVPRYRPVGQA